MVWEDVKSSHTGNNNKHDQEDESISVLYNYIGGQYYMKDAGSRIRHGIDSTPKFTLLHGFIHGIEAYGL